MSKRTAPFEEEIIEEEYVDAEQINSLRESIKNPSLNSSTLK